jgi:hypothetical protein
MATVGNISTQISQIPNKIRKRPGKILVGQQKIVRDIGNNMGIDAQSLHRWYKVTQSQLLRHGGIKLSSKHRYSISRLLITAFPEHKWSVDKFIKFPRKSLLSQPENQRAVMDYCGQQLGLKEGDFDGWYKLSLKSLQEVGGKPLLHHFEGNKLPLLRAAFPEHEWDPQKFATRPNLHWRSIENQREAIKRIGTLLGIKEGDYEAWYNVSKSTLLRNGLMGAISRRTRYSFFSLAFPELDWKPILFSKSKENIDLRPLKPST